MKHIFLICPVRQAGDAVNERIARYVAEREEGGFRVHWPKRDTKQDCDPIGTRICTDNREAMFRRADDGSYTETHIWFDPASNGSMFDMGMQLVCQETHPTFIGKRNRIATIANPDELEAAPSSFRRTLALALADKGSKYDADSREFLDAVCIYGAMYWSFPDETISFRKFSASDPKDLFRLGVAFALIRGTPKKIIVPEGVVAQTPEKSFNNVLLALAELTKDGPKTF